jgi:hypothetical protein
MEIKPFKIKVTPEESRIVQETILSMGIKWRSGSVEVQEYPESLLIIDELNTNVISLCTSTDLVYLEIDIPELTFQQFKELYIDTCNINWSEEFKNIPLDKLSEYCNINKGNPSFEAEYKKLTQWINNKLKNTQKMAEKQKKAPDYVLVNGKNSRLITWKEYENRSPVLDDKDDKFEFLYSEPPKHELKSKSDKSLKKIVKRLDKLIGKFDRIECSGNPDIKIEFSQDKEPKLPKTWEELKMITGWIHKGNGVAKLSTLCQASEFNKCVFATEKQAKSSLAYAQLTQLMKAYDKEWSADWGDNTPLKYVIVRRGDKLVADTNIKDYKFLAFESAELRDKFLENFDDLIKTFYQMD